jgi:ABC-type phosphate transport system substrate-binding protein
MSNARLVKSAAAALLVSLSLTACDPPMPPALLALQSELEVQCEDGVVSAVFPESMTDLSLNWSDSLLFACETMPVTVLDNTATDSDIVIAESSLIAGRCTSFATVPVAIDAAVLVVNIPDFFEIFLSAQQIVDIFNGTITNWSDPALAAFNGDFPLPDLPIILPTEATASAKEALSDWISRLAGSPLDLSAIADTTEFNEISLASPAEPGSINIASYGAAMYQGAAFAAVITDPSDPLSYVRAEYTSLLSATTQLTSSIEGTTMKSSLDPSIEPQAEAGLDEAVPPYQAIYAMTMALCGEDSTLKRTMARYFLRQDSQGVILSSTLMPLPETVRADAISIVVVGLPVPTPATTEETEETDEG